MGAAVPADAGREGAPADPHADSAAGAGRLRARQLVLRTVTRTITRTPTITRTAWRTSTRTSVRWVARTTTLRTTATLCLRTSTRFATSTVRKTQTAWVQATQWLTSVATTTSTRLATSTTVVPSTSVTTSTTLTTSTSVITVTTTLPACAPPSPDGAWQPVCAPFPVDGRTCVDLIPCLADPATPNAAIPLGPLSLDLSSSSLSLLSISLSSPQAPPAAVTFLSLALRAQGTAVLYSDRDGFLRAEISVPAGQTVQWNRNATVSFDRFTALAVAEPGGQQGWVVEGGGAAVLWRSVVVCVAA